MIVKNGDILNIFNYKNIEVHDNYSFGTKIITYEEKPYIEILLDFHLNEDKACIVYYNFYGNEIQRCIINNMYKEAKKKCLKS